MKSLKQTGLILTVIAFCSFCFSLTVVGVTNVHAAPCDNVSILPCKNPTSDKIEDNPIWQLLIEGINILTAVIAVAAIGGIIYGGILYTSAMDSQEQVQKAKTIILNVVIGLVMYMFCYAIMQLLIPGGLFS